MENPLERQLAWVRAVMAYLGGISANDLARRAGIAPSTIQRPLKDPVAWPNLLSNRTLEAIARVAGLEPMQFPTRAGGPGFMEPEASPYAYEEAGSPNESAFDRAVRELTRGRNGRDPWVMQSWALESVGVLPGDVVIVDLNMQPRPKDLVCVQIYDWSRLKAETVFRVYEPPYVVTASQRLGTAKPLAVDDSDVIIRGVVDGILRRPRH